MKSFEKNVDSHAMKVFEERNRALRILYDATVRVNEIENQADIFAILCSSLRKMCKARCAAVASFDVAASELTIKALDAEGWSAREAGHVLARCRKTTVSAERQARFCGRVVVPDEETDGLIRGMIAADERGQAFILPEGDCYELSSLCRGALVAVCLIQMPIGESLRLKDLVDTFLGTMGLILYRLQAEEQLRRNNEQLNAMHKQLQEQQAHLVQQEKMASIGQLAAGIAHEINNPLHYIMGNAAIMAESVAAFRRMDSVYGELARSVQTGDRASIMKCYETARAVREETDVVFVLENLDDMLAEIEEGAQRVCDIVQNLKLFSCTDAANSTYADVNEGIESTLQMVAHELKNKCRIVKELGEIPLIECNPGQLNQVFMNMLLNAGQAIEEQGTITVQTRQVEENEIVVRIADDGCGISEEHIHRLFDPFFTTKDVGKGTGLGLSISHGIVKEHGGRITAESQPGVGTTFSIYLPIKKRKQP